MSEDLDRKLTERLNAGAPAGRDPLFRISVLQRREEDRFRMRNRLVAAGAVVLALGAGAGLYLRPDLIDEAAIALFALAAAAAAWIFSPAVRSFARRWAP
jgi:hypothetical protein